MSDSGLTGMFQGLFFFVVFSDVASALISYFLVNKIAKRTAKYKTVLTFGSWTVLFFGFEMLIYVLVYAASIPDIPSLFIGAVGFTFLSLFSIIYIVTWILGALIVTHENPQGY